VEPLQGWQKIIGGLKERAFPRRELSRRAYPAETPGREAEDLVLLPLNGLVLFPNTIVPLFIAYRSGIAAVEESLVRDFRLFAACVPDSAVPTGQDFPLCGTVVRIVQRLRLPDGSFRVVLQGEYRGTITDILRPFPGAGGREGTGAGKKGAERTSPGGSSYTLVRVEAMHSLPAETDPSLIQAVQRAFALYGELSKKIGADTAAAVEKTENPERLVNLIANAAAVKLEKKLELLSIPEGERRLEAVLEILETENEIYSVHRNISGKVKSRLERNQREFILQEQLKEINKELGKDKTEDEYGDLEKAVAARNPPEEVLAKAQKEIGRLRKLQPFSPEAGVLRGYLEWIADLPWSEYSTDAMDLGEAEKILEEDHFDMRKAKDRILEFIAVRQLSAGSTPSEQDGRVPAVKGPILCFVGPPGTGKTSLGKSVARALGRKFVRISLGGVRDEAEIRGHRKTYVGALPGKIIQSMRRAGTMNPVFLLDEIDKLSSDFRGDPASALLEVLDPEQNFTFTDHYMELAYDLSRVLFIATANSLHSIPYPLLDRMEIIEIPGYGENEKLAIAKRFLVPKELEENGLGEAKVGFTDESLREIIRRWTMESGVRALEREIARALRRIAREAVKKYSGTEKNLEGFRRLIKPGDLEKLLGRRKFKKDLVFKEERIGVTYGLAWTETGGAMLPVETRGFEGNGELIITGNLGDVMKESARIALSWLRSAADNYRFNLDIAKTDFHIHVPEGAIPKDGPSAGITLAASLLSTLCRTAPRPGTAMTGELTLTGRILPIGGLKEKVLAAIRNGMDRILLPEDNREDWEELDRDIREAVSVEFVENAENVFTLLFGTEILKKTGRKTGARKRIPAPDSKALGGNSKFKKNDNRVVQ
jgi:ATP-dependent Lon protease